MVKLLSFPLLLGLETLENRSPVWGKQEISKAKPNTSSWEPVGWQGRLTDHLVVKRVQGGLKNRGTARRFF